MERGLHGFKDADFFTTGPTVYNIGLGWL